MTEKEIYDTFEIILDYHKRYLSKYGVKLVSLKKDGQFTKDALVLTYLTWGYPDTKIVSKAELTQFVNSIYPGTVDVQQARHLALQKGYYIISGTRGDVDESIPSGCYKLKTLQQPYPPYEASRRSSNIDFEELKKVYGFKCATCGSKEGELNNRNSNVKTVLQMGHMNPSKSLDLGNVIPQCQICNRPDRNRWIYDDKGRVIGIADSQDGRRVVEKYLAKLSNNMKIYFYNFLKNIIKK